MRAESAARRGALVAPPRPQRGRASNARGAASRSRGAVRMASTRFSSRTSGTRSGPCVAELPRWSARWRRGPRPRGRQGAISRRCPPVHTSIAATAGAMPCGRRRGGPIAARPRASVASTARPGPPTASASSASPKTLRRRGRALGPRLARWPSGRWLARRPSSTRSSAATPSERCTRVAGATPQGCSPRTALGGPRRGALARSRICRSLRRSRWSVVWRV
mmetsp:Transcript_76498/g.211747  ORF Transcript_76498/g.211747 Transcript_76498/m.211747 type:complete len:221 (-) Transcript_76498:15-677(-)